MKNKYKQIITEELTLRRKLLIDTLLQEAMVIGYEKGLVDHYKQVTREYIHDNLELFTPDINLFPELNAYYKDVFVPHKKNSKDRYKYVLVTVNPNNRVSLDSLLFCYDKAMKKKYIISSVSCVEWTREESDNDNGGLHIHIRIEINNKDPYRVKREFYNSFKKITQPQCVTTLYSNLDNCFLRYLKGEEKNEKDGIYHPKKCMGITKFYRKKYNIDDLF